MARKRGHDAVTKRFRVNRKEAAEWERIADRVDLDFSSYMRLAGRQLYHNITTAGTILATLPANVEIPVNAGAIEPKL